MMLYHRFHKTKLLLASLVFTNIYAQDILYDDSILSTPRKKTLDLQKEQNIQNSSKLKKDWINPIQIQYKKNLGEDNKTSQLLVSINQAIFQSGGIYEAVKYADSTYTYANISLSEQKKQLIQKAINLLFQIEKTNINITKQKLLISNGKIDVKRKKEQVLNGFLDSSYLDNALLTLNTQKINLVNLKYQKQSLINSFHSISSKDYTKFKLPEFSLIGKKEFLAKNIKIKKAKANIKKAKNFSYMTNARYLPSVNIYYNYSKYYNTKEQVNLNNKSQQNYGLSLNIPLDSRTFNDIQSKKIDYLKSKLDLQTKEDEEKNFFKTKLENIEMLKDKISITKESLEVYNSILKSIYEEKEAQLKTQDDVKTLENSQKIKKLDIHTYNIEKQIILLEMYSKVF